MHADPLLLILGEVPSWTWRFFTRINQVLASSEIDITELFVGNHVTLFLLRTSGGIHRFFSFTMFYQTNDSAKSQNPDTLGTLKQMASWMFIPKS